MQTASRLASSIINSRHSRRAARALDGIAKAESAMQSAAATFRRERRFRLKLMAHLRKRGATDLLKRAQASAALFRGFKGARS